MATTSRVPITTVPLVARSERPACATAAAVGAVASVGAVPGASRACAPGAVEGSSAVLLRTRACTAVIGPVAAVPRPFALIAVATTAVRRRRAAGCTAAAPVIVAGEAAACRASPAVV